MKSALVSAIAASATLEDGVVLVPYPGYTGDFKVQGRVGARAERDGDICEEWRELWECDVSVWWELSGLDNSTCAYGLPELDVANSCGVHIHEGSDCTDAASIGGHLYDPSVSVPWHPDPWADVTYFGNRVIGDLEGLSVGTWRHVYIGNVSIASRTIVMHDVTGARVACAELPGSFVDPSESVEPSEVDKPEENVSAECPASRTYAQCGGFTYNGESCCPDGWGCAYVSPEYSQCTMCSEAYGQCGGGPGYNGSTCCTSGFKCTAHGDYYKGCDEDKVPPCTNTLFDTCGGNGWQGEKCCSEGSECRATGPYHSMCQSCATEAYAKCGGKGHTGPTCCTAGFKCMSHGPYHSQCEPATIV